MDSLLWIFCENSNQYFGFSQKITSSGRHNCIFIVLKHNYNHISRYPVFAPLEEETLKQFHISDTLEWCNGTIDIVPEYIFKNGNFFC